MPEGQPKRAENAARFFIFSASLAWKGLQGEGKSVILKPEDAAGFEKERDFLRKNSRLYEKIKEAAASVLPISAIVLFLSITIVPMSVGTLVLFLFGAALAVLGMVFFTLGVDMSMIPMGVGVFLVVAQLRMFWGIRLSYALFAAYGLVFLLAFLAPESFLAVSFDSGGVTTGPVTVPFFMSLGVGMASVRSDKDSGSDSFGLIALCSVGPVLSVLLLGILYEPASVTYEAPAAANPQTTVEAARLILASLPEYMKEVATAIGPIVLIFFLFQGLARRFHRWQVFRILSGFVYTYAGLVLFLTGVNTGFMPAGQKIGQLMAQGSRPWLLVPVGMLMGYFIVKAEPAVQVLCRQVEEASDGAITEKVIGRSLSAGVAVAVGLGMLRILTGIPVLWFLAPGYGAALLMTFLVPQMFTAVAFDSGGVASGPMTATFVLPLGMGACAALGGDIMSDAFGMVALVALAPLFTLQMVGLKSELERRNRRRTLLERTAAQAAGEWLKEDAGLDGLSSGILYLD